jgi:hypothetical protein
MLGDFWGRSIEKTWLASVFLENMDRILPHLTFKKKQLVNAARRSWAVQPLHWAQSRVWFVWLSPKMGVPVASKSTKNHRFAKNCSSQNVC